MTIKQKLDRLVQAVASYERADMHLQNLPGKGYWRRTRHSQSWRGCPTGDALGEAVRRPGGERDQGDPR